MKFSADQVDRMSLWQFLAAQGGVERANGGSTDPGLSDEEVDDIWESVKP